MRVLLGWYASEDEVARVQAGLPAGVEIVHPTGVAGFSRFEATLPDVESVIADVDAFITWVVPPGTVEAAGKLGILVWMHTGIDILPLGELRDRGIRLANIGGGNAIAVVEHAMALMLGLAKRIVDLQRSAVTGEVRPHWNPAYSTVLLQGKTLLVVGLGRIGAEIARRARAFDMRVVGVRRNRDLPCAHADSVHGRDELPALLSEADYVVLAAPLTPDTRNLIGAAELGAMKPSAYLINIARGHLVDEVPLHAALTSGRLAGFASDVWWHYPYGKPPTHHFPVPSRTGLHRLPNVLPTGDQAANVIELKDVEIDMATESVAAFLRGETVPREIDLVVGY